MKNTFFLFLITFFFAVACTENTKKKDTLYIGFETKVSAWNPRLIGGDANSMYLEGLRFVSLVSSDKNGNTVNNLAKDITFHKTQSRPEVHIELKPGITFTNGKEITAQDVIATYESIMSPKEGLAPSPRKGAFENIESITLAKQPNTIIFTLKKPDAAFVTNLVVGILPKELAHSKDAGDLINAGAESGPFKLKKYNDLEIVLEANNNYKISHPPLLKSVIFKIIPNSGSRYAALKKGDLDLVQNSIDADKFKLIEDQKGEGHLITKKAPRLSTTYLGINFRNSFLGELPVRKAIAHGIDKKKIITHRYNGLARIANSMFPKDNYYYDEKLVSYDYSPKNAQKVLKKIKNKGKEFSLLVPNSNKVNVEIARIIAKQLQEIGLNPKLEILELSIFFDKVKKGIADIWLAKWIGFKDPDHLRFVFASNMTPPQGANRGAFKNKALDILFNKGLEITNTLKRKDIYDKAQTIINNELPYIFLWHEMNTAILNKRVKGYELFADGHYRSLANVSLEEIPR